MLEKVLRANRLLEAYSSLLPPKQAQICVQYYLENLSLAEIAENEGISRQAVHESIERALNAMEAADRAMDLINRQEKLAALCEEVRSSAQKASDIKDEHSFKGLMAAIGKLSSEI